MHRVLILTIFIFFAGRLAAQDINLRNESERIEFQERNVEKKFSYLFHPMSDDSLMKYAAHTLQDVSRKQKGTVGIFAPDIRTQFNAGGPFSWNDGPMIPNKGLQILTSAGIFVKKGIFSLQLRPEFVYAESRRVMGFPVQYSDSLWQARYKWYNWIDQPESWSAPYRSFFPGQSNLKIKIGKLAAGISSENRWWGPGKQNSLLLSNNAPGFPHFFIKTEKPLSFKPGRFEFQFLMGELAASGQFPPDTNRTYQGTNLYKAKPADGRRYINGVVLAYQPSFLKGFSIGMGRVVYQYSSERENTLDGWFPVFGFLFKNKTPGEDKRRRDQMLSLYLRQSFNDEKTFFYLEYGRNDHAWNLRDLIQNPEHSRGYVTGIQHQIDLKKRRLQLTFELTDLARTGQLNMRPTPDWYVHHQVVHGYTHRGQVVGAGIGPGSDMQSVNAEFLKDPSNYFGVGVYRITRNKDFFYDVFSRRTDQYNRKWVDLALEAKWAKSFKRSHVFAQVFLVQSMNHQYQDHLNNNGLGVNDKNLFQLSASIRWQFNLFAP
jgi:hypothetical protein